MMNCVAFNVEHDILDLLGDRAIFVNLNNLVVNRHKDPEREKNEPELRFAPYTPVDGGDEVLDGDWSRDAHNLKDYKVITQLVKEEFERYIVCC